VENLDNAMVGLDWGHADEKRKQICLWLHSLAPRCGTMRTFGSAALVLAHTAAGWLDGYFNLGMKPWDVTAGLLMITEAGGRCSTLEGKPYHVGALGCLATNSLIHEELLAVIREADGITIGHKT
jgi:myo-inositol-1(or 4)-monophosphatase